MTGSSGSACVWTVDSEMVSLEVQVDSEEGETRLPEPLDFDVNLRFELEFEPPSR